MRAYEIHTYKDGKWKMDSVFDDRELAVFEAKKITEGSRYSGVKVIEENYDELTNLTTTRTLFRGGAAREERYNKPAANAKPGAQRTGTAKERNRKGGGKSNRKNQSNILVPVLVLLAILAAGFALLFGLRYYSAGW